MSTEVTLGHSIVPQLRLEVQSMMHSVLLQRFSVQLLLELWRRETLLRQRLWSLHLVGCWLPCLSTNIGLPPGGSKITSHATPRIYFTHYRAFVHVFVGFGPRHCLEGFASIVYFCHSNGSHLGVQNVLSL